MPNVLESLRMLSALTSRPTSNANMGGIPSLGSLPISRSPFTTPQQPQMEQPDINIDERFRQIYQPQNAANERLNSLLMNQPQRQNPSTLLKIGAVMAGIGRKDGLEVMDQTAYAPYYRGMQGWMAGIDPTLKSADLENDANLNLRNLANQQVQREISQRDLERKEKADIARADTANKNAESTRMRAEGYQKRTEILDFKRQNPHYVFKTREDGMIVGLNPLTGQSFTTDVKSGDLSDMEKAQLQLENRLAGISAQGAIRDKQIERQGELTSGQITQRADETRKTNAARPPTTGGTRELLPTQERQRIVNRVTALRLENPELGKLVTIGSDGFLNIKTDNAQLRKQINEYLGIHKSAAGTSNVPISNATDRVTVQDAKGGKFTIPASQLDAFLKSEQGKGFKKVQ